MAGVVEVDLHLHTTHSDGTLTPSELVQLCYRKGLKVIAVTDHDSTEGVAQSLKTARDLGGPTVIPGIELSAAADGLEVHLLGYYLDHQDIGLQSVLTGLRSGREERARQMVERLKDIGVPVSWGRVVELSAGRRHRPAASGPGDGRGGIRTIPPRGVRSVPGAGWPGLRRKGPA